MRPDCGGEHAGVREIWLASEAAAVRGAPVGGGGVADHGIIRAGSADDDAQLLAM